MIGKLTILQSAVLMKYCKLYIGNDTGLMHLAAAAKVQIVEISCWPKSGNKMDGNSPYLFGPWKVKHIVVNPEKPLEPCRDSCIFKHIPHCITQIKVDRVIEAVEKLLSLGDFK